MTLVECYPIGVIKMLDDGHYDEKIIAIPFSAPNYNNFKSVYDLPKHKFDEMMHFFSVYKQLEEKETVVNELAGPDEAKRIIEDAIHHYNEVYGSRPREN